MQTKRTSASSKELKFRYPFAWMVEIGFCAGVIGSIAETVFTTIVRALHVSPVNREMAIGYFLTHSIGVLGWCVGFLVHVVVGGILGWLYVFGFIKLIRPDWVTGMIYGFCIWFVTGLLVVSMIPGVDFVVPQQSRVVDPLWINYGLNTVYAIGASHILFGGVLGGVFQIACKKRFGDCDQ